MGYTLPPHDNVRLLLASAYELARTRSTMDMPLRRMLAHVSATMREQCRVTTSAPPLFLFPSPLSLSLSRESAIAIANHRGRHRLDANLFQEEPTIPDQHIDLISDSCHSSRFLPKCKNICRHSKRRFNFYQ